MSTSFTVDQSSYEFQDTGDLSVIQQQGCTLESAYYFVILVAAAIAETDTY